MKKKNILTIVAASLLAVAPVTTLAVNSSNTVVQAKTKNKVPTYRKLFGKKHSKDPYIEKWRKQIVKHAYWYDDSWNVTLVANRTLHSIEEKDYSDDLETELLVNKGDQVILAYPNVAKTGNGYQTSELKKNRDEFSEKLISSNKNLNYSFVSKQDEDDDDYPRAYNVTCFSFGKYNPAKDTKLNALKRKLKKYDYKLVPKHSNVTVYTDTESTDSSMPTQLVKNKTMNKSTKKMELLASRVRGQYYYTDGTYYWNIKDVSLKR